MVTRARSIPDFGPILEDGWNLCPLSWSAVIMTINNVITLSITLAIVFVAPVMIAYSGFLLVTNAFNPGAKADAKKILTNTILGIVIALAGWMIVDALMAVLYHPTDLGLAGKTWSELITGGSIPVCIPAASILRQASNGANVVGESATGVVTVIPPSQAPASETAVRQQLASAGVQVNRPTACSPYNANGVTGGCTNVGGMLPSTVDQVISIKRACGGCTVIVTGGSEAGHASGAHSHGLGYKVDLGLNGTLNAFLQRLELTGQRGGDSGGPIRKDSCGNEYVQESSHWDITVFRTCAL
ncbi:MAG: pilin [Candidatus Paceibacterota bacterium]